MSQRFYDNWLHVELTLVAKTETHHKVRYDDEENTIRNMPNEMFILERFKELEVEE